MNGIAYLMISKNLLVFLVLSTKLNHFLVIVIYFEQISSVWGTPWLVPTGLDLNLVTTTFTKRLSLLNHINILLFKKKTIGKSFQKMYSFGGSALPLINTRRVIMLSMPLIKTCADRFPELIMA